MRNGNTTLTDRRKSLGQFMTPVFLADLAASLVPQGTNAVLDLAAGDGSLLCAVNRRDQKVALFGFEVDAGMCRKAKMRLPEGVFVQTDGLRAGLRRFLRAGRVRGVIGNPPFGTMEPTEADSEALMMALPGTTTKHGTRRSELYFLARALLLLQAQHAESLVIIMPVSFAESDFFHQYRASLLANYWVVQSVEIPPSCFDATEARVVVLTIYAKIKSVSNTLVSCCERGGTALRTVYDGQITEGGRLDGRYYLGQVGSKPSLPNLSQLGVSVTRGRTCHKDARKRDIGAIHTGDLQKVHTGKLLLRRRQPGKCRKAIKGEILARTGDILLARTGSRVYWNPVVVEKGYAPITDHVFRIRVSSQLRPIVEGAFRHPAFAQWLALNIRGICSAVLSKRLLLTMPVFSLESAVEHYLEDQR